MVKYILEEASVKEENWDKAMESRLPLLLQSIQNAAKDVIQWLLSETGRNQKALLLLLMVYMSLPYTGRYLKDAKTDQFTEAAFSRISTGSIDVISHTLLSALTATSRSKDWARKSQVYNN